MHTYRGIIDGMDMQKINLQRSVDNTLQNTRIVIEEGYKNELKAETRAVVHLSLLDRFGYFFCLSSSYNLNFALRDFGINYFRNNYHLRNTNRGLVWAIIEPTPPEWLRYETEELAWVNDFEHEEIKRRTIQLINIPPQMSLLCVLFYVIKSNNHIIGTLAVDIYTQQDAVDARIGIPIYTIFLDALSSTIGLVLEGLHTAYYDAKLNRQLMKCIFSPAYLIKAID